MSKSSIAAIIATSILVEDLNVSDKQKFKIQVAKYSTAMTVAVYQDDASISSILLSLLQSGMDSNTCNQLFNNLYAKASTIAIDANNYSAPTLNSSSSHIQQQKRDKDDHDDIDDNDDNDDQESDSKTSSNSTISINVNLTSIPSDAILKIGRFLNKHECIILGYVCRELYIETQSKSFAINRRSLQDVRNEKLILNRTIIRNLASKKNHTGYGYCFPLHLIFEHKSNSKGSSNSNNVPINLVQMNIGKSAFSRRLFTSLQSIAISANFISYLPHIPINILFKKHDRGDMNINSKHRKHSHSHYNSNNDNIYYNENYNYNTNLTFTIQCRDRQQDVNLISKFSRNYKTFFENECKSDWNEIRRVETLIIELIKGCSKQININSMIKSFRHNFHTLQVKTHTRSPYILNTSDLSYIFHKNIKCLKIASNYGIKVDKKLFEKGMKMKKKSIQRCKLRKIQINKYQNELLQLLQQLELIQQVEHLSIIRISSISDIDTFIDFQNGWLKNNINNLRLKEQCNFNIFTFELSKDISLTNIRYQHTCYILKNLVELRHDLINVAPASASINIEDDIKDDRNTNKHRNKNRNTTNKSNKNGRIRSKSSVSSSSNSNSRKKKNKGQTKLKCVMIRWNIKKGSHLAKHLSKGKNIKTDDSILQLLSDSKQSYKKILKQFETKSNLVEIVTDLSLSSVANIYFNLIKWLNKKMLQFDQKHENPEEKFRAALALYFPNLT